MKKSLKIVFLSFIIISNAFCSEKLVDSKKIADAKNCDLVKNPACKTCPQWSIATLDNKGKTICVECPKNTTMTAFSKNEGIKCSGCPKGAVLKEYKPIPGVIPAPGMLKYTCGCKDDNSYPVSQPDGSVKCTKCPKGVQSSGTDYIEDKKRETKKIVYFGSCMK